MKMQILTNVQTGRRHLLRRQMVRPSDAPEVEAPSRVEVHRLLRLLGVAAALFVFLSLSGCARVAAHQRGRLAHPTMEAGAFGSKAAGHVYAISEGAMGGEVGAAAGCGCN